MLKIIFYTLLISSSVLFFSSCIADRQSSPESRKANEAKSDEKPNKGGEETASEKPNEQKETDTSALSKTEDEADKTDERSEYKNSGSKPELRCGWYMNPTPGNHWLQDKDAEWTLGVQGGFQAEGDYPPEFSDSQWVKTNGYYGYGCVCLRVVVDRKEQRILKVISGNAKPLSACRNDPALSEPSE